MMDLEYYRDQSTFCANIASTVSDADGKDRWLTLARQWGELAEEAEKGSRSLKGAIMAGAQKTLRLA